MVLNLNNRVSKNLFVNRENLSTELFQARVAAFIFDKDTLLLPRLAPNEWNHERSLPSSQAFLSSAYQVNDNAQKSYMQTNL